MKLKKKIIIPALIILAVFGLGNFLIYKTNSAIATNGTAALSLCPQPKNFPSLSCYSFLSSCSDSLDSCNRCVKDYVNHDLTSCNDYCKKGAANTWMSSCVPSYSSNVLQCAVVDDSFVDHNGVKSCEVSGRVVNTCACYLSVFGLKPGTPATGNGL